MSSSDSEVETRRGRVPPKARGGDDSSSDSDDNRRGAVVRRGVTRGAAAKRKDDDSDSDDSGDEGPAVPTRRPVRGGKKGGSGSDSSSDTDDDSAPASGERKPRQAQLWVAINYDDMTQESFYQLLKEKSRQSRIEEKRMAEQIAESNKGEEEAPLEAFIDDNTDGYHYADMLKRIYDELRLKNPELGDGSNKRVKLPVPKTEKSSTKTTALTNFKEMCKAMNREMEHVKDFIEKELTTSTSVDGNNCLIMKIRNVKAMQIEHVFQKYVEEFCQCGNCGRIDTTLERNPVNRLWILKCKSCHASRTVQAAAGATYRAQIGRRPRAF